MGRNSSVSGLIAKSCIFIIFVMPVSCVHQDVVPVDFDALLAAAEEKMANDSFHDASALFHRALQLRPDSINARTGLARSYCLMKQWDAALSELETVFELDPSCREAFFLKASALLAGNKYAESADMFKLVLDGSGTVFQERDKEIIVLSFARALHHYEFVRHLNEGYELAEFAVKACPEYAVFHGYFAFFAQELGYAEKAREEYEAALGINPYSTEIVIKARSFFVRNLEFRKALDIWLKIAPEDMLLSPQNIMAPVYADLISLAGRCESDRTNGVLLQNFALACKKAGWLEEAVGVCDYVDSLPAGEYIEPARALKSVIVQHLRFLDRLKKTAYDIYDGYYFNNVVTGINEVLDKIRGIDDTIPELQTGTIASVFSNIPYAEEVNTFNNPESPLNMYFLKFGEFFSITSYFGLLDINVMPVLFRESSETKILSKSHRVDCIIGDYNFVETLSEYIAGYPQIAGLTYLTASGYYVNSEALRPSSKSFQSLLDMAGNAALGADSSDDGGESLYGHVSDDVTEPVYSAHAARELLLKAFSEYGRSADSVSWQDIFLLNVEAVRRHESGHIHDTRFFTPFSENLFNNFFLGLEHMFSPAQIRSRFESAAETTGILYMSTVHWMIFENMSRLRPVRHDLLQKIYSTWYGEEPENSVYCRIARDILEGMAAEIIKKPQEYTDIDCTLNITQQFHKLTPLQIRKLALRLLPEYIVR